MILGNKKGKNLGSQKKEVRWRTFWKGDSCCWSIRKEESRDTCTSPCLDKCGLKGRTVFKWPGWDYYVRLLKHHRQDWAHSLCAHLLEVGLHRDPWLNKQTNKTKQKNSRVIIKFPTWLHSTSKYIKKKMLGLLHSPSLQKWVQVELQEDSWQLNKSQHSSGKFEFPFNKRSHFH